MVTYYTGCVVQSRPQGDRVGWMPALLSPLQRTSSIVCRMNSEVTAKAWLDGIPAKHKPCSRLVRAGPLVKPRLAQQWSLQIGRQGCHVAKLQGAQSSSGSLEMMPLSCGWYKVCLLDVVGHIERWDFHRNEGKHPVLAGLSTFRKTVNQPLFLWESPSSHPLRV
jgi:hypothetical protein